MDPLAEQYAHNSPYAFSENKVTSHFELEGLEAIYSNGWLVQPHGEMPDDFYENPNRVTNGDALMWKALMTGMNEVGKMTDLNDATILATWITRGNEGAINIDNSHADGVDKTFASIGAFLPFVSGSGAKKGLKAFFNSLATLTAKSEVVQKGVARAFKIEKGIIKFEEKTAERFHDFVLTEAGELRLGSGHYFLADQGKTKIKAAGEIFVGADGKIRSITNNTGHFKANSDELKKAAALLKEAGLTSDDFVAIDVNLLKMF